MSGLRVLYPLLQTIHPDGKQGPQVCVSVTGRHTYSVALSDTSSMKINLSSVQNTGVCCFTTQNMTRQSVSTPYSRYIIKYGNCWPTEKVLKTKQTSYCWKDWDLEQCYAEAHVSVLFYKTQETTLFQLLNFFVLQFQCYVRNSRNAKTSVGLLSLVSRGHLVPSNKF